MKYFKWAFLSVALVAGYASAADADTATTSDDSSFFSGITLGAGYAQDRVFNDTLVGYSVYSKAYIVPSLKDYLFTDFRVTHTTDDVANIQQGKTGPVQISKLDLERYQASIGVDYPFQVTKSIQMKPYLTGGWSWDKFEFESRSRHEDGFMGAVGVETVFGRHVSTDLGYSDQLTGDVQIHQFMLDVGYKF
ncbi:outer membrane protein [Vibrio rarus]|uniref:outer membrane protein n=1 Tax=Vibrio rarus TaxID=413403 RepID=UPI0021C469BD|nr:porin family protein [Vibrio rarus]